MNLQKVYSNRFSAAEQQRKKKLWDDLYSGFFSQYIRNTDVILDLAAGYCEFINAAYRQANAKGRYIAVDVNPDTRNHAESGVEFIQADATDLRILPENSVDIVFVSNFFEHVRDKENILVILREVNRVLKTDGSLLVLQPNIRYIGMAYWDFFDHFTPLTEKSMAEAVELAGGFEIIRLIPRFLPYTTKSPLFKFSALTKLYLKCPIIWNIFGKQLFLAAKKQKKES